MSAEELENKYRHSFDYLELCRKIDQPLTVSEQKEITDLLASMVDHAMTVQNHQELFTLWHHRFSELKNQYDTASKWVSA